MMNAKGGGCIHNNHGGYTQTCAGHHNKKSCNISKHALQNDRQREPPPQQERPSSLLLCTTRPSSTAEANTPPRVAATPAHDVLGLNTGDMQKKRHCIWSAELSHVAAHAGHVLVG